MLSWKLVHFMVRVGAGYCVAMPFKFTYTPPQECLGWVVFGWKGSKIMKFSRKNIENWLFWKTQFFWVGHFGLFFQFFFALSPWKSVKVSKLARIGRNFDDYPGFQPFRSWANTYAQDCTCLFIQIFQKLTLSKFYPDFILILSG